MTDFVESALEENLRHIYRYTAFEGFSFYWLQFLRNAAISIAHFGTFFYQGYCLR